MSPIGDDDVLSHETMRHLIVGVYAAGVLPLSRRVVARWRGVRRRPVTILGALAATIVAVPVIALYVVLATLVPLTVAFLLVISSPVLLWVAVGKAIDRAPVRARRAPAAAGRDPRSGRSVG